MGIIYVVLKFCEINNREYSVYKGIGILITDHNVHETLSIVDRAYILIEGKIFKEGRAEDLAADEEVKKLYLGEKFKLERYV